MCECACVCRGLAFLQCPCIIFQLDFNMCVCACEAVEIQLRSPRHGFFENVSVCVFREVDLVSFCSYASMVWLRALVSLNHVPYKWNPVLIVQK